MPHRKKEIKVEIHIPLEKNMEKFQNRVNIAWTEMVEIHLEKAKMDRMDKIDVLDRLEITHMKK